ncbi:nitrogenase-stabilizing/protective protein NifW [Roseospira goensis]|uniref:Nitrogenase-stabilizing/protective protein NifW n=1 Tax=Roseospira goensis TaxID=391922 RepID=A0A7W6S2G6_9PROT|nr:nitrogenase-stabilizing/protective protein NifW [Roseospira goensis]MBB4287663.1 hypothetical protein [Roseospira goensis]
MTDGLCDLAGLCSAEEFFAALAVPVDPARLAPRRLHVLHRFRAHVAAAGPTPDRETLRACLVRAWAEVSGGTRADFAVFAPRPDAAGRTFVPLAALDTDAPAAPRPPEGAPS